MYCEYVPVPQNQICREYGLAIIEDDPYFYLQHRADQPDNNDNENTSTSAGREEGEKSAVATSEKEDEVAKAATKASLQKLGPSFLSLDTDGRVLRIDSFSKVRHWEYYIGALLSLIFFTVLLLSCFSLDARAWISFGLGHRQCSLD